MEQHSWDMVSNDGLWHVIQFTYISFIYMYCIYLFTYSYSYLYYSYSYLLLYYMILHVYTCLSVSEEFNFQFLEAQGLWCLAARRSRFAYWTNHPGYACHTSMPFDCNNIMSAYHDDSRAQSCYNVSLRVLEFLNFVIWEKKTCWTTISCLNHKTHERHGHWFGPIAQRPLATPWPKTTKSLASRVGASGTSPATKWMFAKIGKFDDCWWVLMIFNEF